MLWIVVSIYVGEDEIVLVVYWCLLEMCFDVLLILVLCYLECFVGVYELCCCEGFVMVWCFGGELVVCVI